MRVAMGKLSSVPMIVMNGCRFYNMCLIKQIYFRCSLFTLMPKEEEILQDASERIILRKLGHSERFPRKITCYRKLALRARLMKPKTIIDVSAFKLCAE